MEDNLLENRSIGTKISQVAFLKTLIERIENIEYEEQINRAIKSGIPFTEGFFISLVGFDNEERNRLCTYLLNQFPLLQELKVHFLKIEKQYYFNHDIDSDEIEMFLECYDYIEVLKDMEEYKMSDEYQNDQKDELTEVEKNGNLSLLNSQQIGYMFNLFQDRIIKKNSVSFLKYAAGMQFITGRSKDQLQNKRNRKLSKDNFEQMFIIFQGFISDIEKEIQKF